MKKISLLTVCLIMICSISLNVFAEVKTPQAVDIDETLNLVESIDEEVNILTYAGVIELAEQYDPNTVVTRAEFVNYTAAAIKADEKMSVSYFSDVPMSYWAADSINALVDRGIIDMADDGKFNPDEPITYSQACKVLSAVTGYKAYADPDKIMNEYILVAQKAGFGINPKSNEKITLAEAVVLLYNAMRTNLMTLVSKKGDDYYLKPQKGDNIFSVYHKIKFEDGQVQSLYGKTLNAKNAEQGQAYIDSKKYIISSDVDLENYFGRHIDFVYVVDPVKDENTVIYARPSYKNDKMTVLSKDIAEYNEKSRVLSYTDEKTSKIKTKTLAENASVVFNGQPYINEIKPKINEFTSGSKKGRIDFVSTEGGSSIDLLIITSYEIFASNSYNVQTGKFYSSDKQRTIEIDEFEYFSAIDSLGTKIDKTSISNGPFMIAASDDKESINIIICKSSVSGSVNSINTDNRIFNIDGIEYTADKHFWTENSDKIRLGSTYTMYIDSFGEMIEISNIASDAMKIGYITDSALRDNVFEKKVCLKIYTPEDETLSEFEVADKVSIDSIDYKSENYKNIVSAFPGNVKADNDTIKIERQVIRYHTNASGVIDKIDTRNISESEDKDNSLNRMSSGAETLLYSAVTNRLGMIGYMKANQTMVIAVPAVNDNEEIIINGKVAQDDIKMYSNKFTFTDYQQYTAELYKFSDNTLSMDLVVVYPNFNMPNYDVIMYDEIITGLENETDTVKKLSGFSTGGKVELTIDESIDLSTLNLKKGDIVRTETNIKKNRIYSIVKMFDAEKMQFEKNETWVDPDRYWYGGNYIEGSGAASSWRGPSYQMSKGYLFCEKDNIISLSYTLSMANKDIISEISDVSRLPVTIYDKKLNKNQIFTGKVSELLSYKTVGAGCDLVLVSSQNTTLKQLFVLRQEQ